MQGYFGGWIDLLFQRFIEIWSGLPVLYLLIILASIVEPTFWWLLGLMLLFSWMALVGVVRAEFLRARNFDYVRAARALGVRDRVIMFRHVLPNAMVATLTFLPFILTGSITTLTSLDFLGFGLPPGSPSLGELLAQGKANLQAPWLGLTGFVVLAVMLSLLVFIGEAVRDAFDPRKIRVTMRAARGARPLGVVRPSAGREVPAVRHVSFAHRARRDVGAGRRERLGQVGDRAVDPAAPALSDRAPPQRQHPLPAARSCSARREAALRAVRGNRIAMIFQEPMTSLNPLHTIEKQISEVLLRAQGPGAARRRGRGRSSCCAWSGCRRPSSGSTPIRTSSRAASASG